MPMILLRIYHERYVAPYPPLGVSQSAAANITIAGPSRCGRCHPGRTPRHTARRGVSVASRDTAESRTGIRPPCNAPLGIGCSECINGDVNTKNTHNICLGWEKQLMRGPRVGLKGYQTASAANDTSRSKTKIPYNASTSRCAPVQNASKQSDIVPSMPVPAWQSKVAPGVYEESDVSDGALGRG